QEIARAHIERQGATMRLTAPGTWGIASPGTRGDVPQVVFTYGALGFFLLCGEVHGDLCGTGVNAFALESTARTMVSFGIDNTVALLVGALGSSVTHTGCKSFDHFLLNDFFLLEGSKFSPSRNHIIGVTDLVSRLRGGSDAVRAYLAKVSPEQGPTDFRV